MDHKAQVSPRPSTDRSPAKPSGHPLPHRILNWFAALDYGYRQAHKLSTLSDERLTDIGGIPRRSRCGFLSQEPVTRRKASTDQAFRTSGPRRIADQIDIVAMLILVGWLRSSALTASARRQKCDRSGTPWPQGVAQRRAPDQQTSIKIAQLAKQSHPRAPVDRRQIVDLMQDIPSRHFRRQALQLVLQFRVVSCSGSRSHCRHNPIAPVPHRIADQPLLHVRQPAVDVMWLGVVILPTARSIRTSATARRFGTNTSCRRVPSVYDRPAGHPSPYLPLTRQAVPGC